MAQTELPGFLVGITNYAQAPKKLQWLHYNGDFYDGTSNKLLGIICVNNVKTVLFSRKTSDLLQALTKNFFHRTIKEKLARDIQQLK